MTTRILIADDQDDIRSGFRLILDSQPDMTVVGEAADGESAVALARELRPDVVLADIRMPRLDGLEVTRLLAPQTRVVVVTTFDLDEYVHTALRNGACGFLLKRSGPALLIEGVRAAMAGDTLISPQITVRLLSRLAQAGPVARPAAHPLTEREVEIVRLVARGSPTPRSAPSCSSPRVRQRPTSRTSRPSWGPATGWESPRGPGSTASPNRIRRRTRTTAAVKGCLAGHVSRETTLRVSGQESRPTESAIAWPRSVKVPPVTRGIPKKATAPAR